MQKESNPNSAYTTGVVEAVDGAETQVPVGSTVILRISSKEEQSSDNGGSWWDNLFG